MGKIRRWWKWLSQKLCLVFTENCLKKWKSPEVKWKRSEIRGKSPELIRLATVSQTTRCCNWVHLWVIPGATPVSQELRLQFAQAHWNLTAENWENIACFDESRFLLWHPDGRVRIWCKQHERMDPSCLLSAVQPAGCFGCTWVPVGIVKAPHPT